MPRKASTSRIPTVTSKSYPHIKPMSDAKKPQQLGLLNMRRLIQTEHHKNSLFQPKPFAAMHNVEKAIAACAAEYSTKGKPTLSALRTLSLKHTLICDTAFENICIDLILCDYLSATDVKNLNTASEPFTHFHKMLSCAEPRLCIANLYSC